MAILKAKPIENQEHYIISCPAFQKSNTPTLRSASQQLHHLPQLPIGLK